MRLKSAYEAGYIDKESLTNATSDCRTKFYEDKFGVFTYWAGTWATNLKTNLEANGLDSELVAIPPIEELGAYTERVAPAWCITEACPNPEGVYKYFNREHVRWRRYAVLMDIWCRGCSLVNSS